MFCACSTVWFLPSSFCLPSDPMPYQSVMPRGPTGPGYRALHSGTHRWCVVLSICLTSAVCLWPFRVSVFSSLVYIRAVRRAGLGSFCCGMLHSGIDMPGTLAFCCCGSVLIFRPFTSLLPHPLCHFRSCLVASLAYVIGAPSLLFLWFVYFCYVASVTSPVTPGS